MTEKPGKTERKRISKGQRTHTRRLKQAARAEIGTNNPQANPVQVVRVPKKQDKS